MTYSIVAVDTETGAAGAACATGILAVGAFVPAARADAGAIATQGASTNWLYGERGLDLLADGRPAREALDRLTGDDAGRDYRQCIVIDRDGQSAGWTGPRCEAARQHVTALGVAAGGNLLAQEDVVQSMVAAFDAWPQLSFSERLLAALQAGEAAGGDARGIVSAALYADFRDRPPIDIRVDYQPGTALETLADLHGRYLSEPFRAFYESVPTRADYGKFERE